MSSPRSTGSRPICRGWRRNCLADVKVTLLTDRTTGIRASVSDVQVELVISVLLVVLVIFLFLGSLRATVVAGISVPLSLIGAFSAMWALGFSINNLSLMALTIASGFVVDDAIVVLENIARHIEEGMKPFDAALRGASEIGFTIISLTVSLVRGVDPAAVHGAMWSGACFANSRSAWRSPSCCRRWWR